MPLSPEIRERIVNRLVRGDSIKSIAEAFNKPIGQIQAIRNESLKNNLDHAVDSLSKADANVVKALANSLEDEGMVRASKVAKTVAEGVEALQILQPKITQALDRVVEKLNNRLEDKDFEMKEIPMISKTLIEINTALYNRPTNQINVVQQNNDNRVIQQAATEKINSLLTGIIDIEEEN